MRQRVRKFQALPRAERAVLVQALFWLPITVLILRLRGFAAFNAAPRGSTAGRNAGIAPQRVAELVAIAARHGLCRGNCLSQSLALQRLLRRGGDTAQLRIGARRGPAGLEAHAWIEIDGRPLNDSADVAERFAPFPPPLSFPRKRESSDFFTP